MNKKSKGMTLVEIIIAIALTTTVLIVIGTFFFTNSKMLSTADVKSELQKDSDNIQTELVKIGSESNGISKIKYDPDPSGVLQSSSSVTYQSLVGTEKQLPVYELYFTHYTNEALTTTKEYKFVLNKDVGAETGKLTLTYQNGTEKVLSKNVVDFKIKPIGVEKIPDVELKNHKFDETEAIEVVVNLRKKSGFVDETLPVNVVINMRNKDAISL